MGATRERATALLNAIRELPEHSQALWQRYRFGNPALTAWHNRVTEEGRRHAVIVMIERLGDIIACTPIARQLKEQNPTLAITWICSQKYSDVLVGNPYIDAVFHEESLTTWLLTKSHLKPPLQCYELFLDTQRCCWTGMKLPRRKSGITHKNYLNPGSNLLIAYSKAAGFPEIQDEQPQLFLPDIQVHLPHNFGSKPVMAIHFDSEDPDRRLSDEAIFAFTKNAINNGWGIVELGLRPLAAAKFPEVYFPGKSISLPAQLQILKSAAHFAGVNSAFLHGANAYSVPSTIYIGRFRQFSYYTPFSGSFFFTEKCNIIWWDTNPSKFSGPNIENTVPRIQLKQTPC